MKLEHFPDEGAFITVHMRHGGTLSGYVAPGHVFATDLLCLSDEAVTHEKGNYEVKWVYVDTADVVAWEWDCRP